jgi:hypothetical protein
MSIAKAQIENSAGLSMSNLNVDDLLDEEIPQNLRSDCARDHPLTVGIFRHTLQVAGRYHQECDHGEHRQQRQDGGGQATSAAAADLPFGRKALADHIRQP